MALPVMLLLKSGDVWVSAGRWLQSTGHISEVHSPNRSQLLCFLQAFSSILAATKSTPKGNRPVLKSFIQYPGSLPKKNQLKQVRER